MSWEYKALVVDDEEAIRALLVRSLKREGFSCDAAADGRQAQELLESSGYDVVITDLRMPVHDGYALAKELLSLEDRPRVIVLTGVLERQIAKELLQQGVDDIAFKPIDYEVFALKVKQMINRAEKPRARAPLVEQSDRQRPAWRTWWSSLGFRWNSPVELSPSELLTDSTEPHTLEELRDRAILSLALQGGLTGSEIAALKVGDLDVNQGFEAIWVNRGEAARVSIRIKTETAQAIRDYLQASNHATDREHPLFQPLLQSESCQETGHLESKAVDNALLKYVESVRVPAVKS